MSVLKRTLTRWSQSFSPDKKFSISTRKIIGDYSYCQTDKIGQGYSSCVFRGRSNKTEQQVAIKVINIKTLKKDQLHLSLLHSQIEILKQMTNQPNILHLFNTYTTKNNVYIITECCNTDLAKILKTKQRFPLFEALDIIIQVLSGYLHLSQKGFIHRDLKPANILYKDGIYMIGDFGFAVLAGTIKSTNNQYNVGSPLYMAPESLEDNKYNFSTDMWSIGIILYQMIIGKTPWYATDQKQLYHKIMVRPITKVLNDIPVECRDFIKGVLSIDPKERLSPSEVLEWLNYFLELVEKEECEISPPIKKSQEQPLKVTPFEKPTIQTKNLTNQRPSSANFPKNKQRPKSPFHIKVDRTVRGQCINQPHTPVIINQPVDYKIRTLLYYCKFIHRILLILTSPLKYQFPSSETLQRYLVDILLLKIERLYNLKPTNNWCKFTHLEQYLKNPNKQLQKAVSRAYQKYVEMYQSDNKFPTIELTIVQKSIHQLKKYLQQSFDDKSILIMDYLTTLYQLFRLQQRYDMNKFCSLCKLDTIMQRNPTQISQQHLQKLNNKIIILGI